MAIKNSAKRAIRVSARKRVVNLRRVGEMKDDMREIRKMAEAGNHEGVKKALPGVYKAIDKAAKRGVIKKNTASRKKSRIVAFIKKHSKTVAKETKKKK